MNRFVFLFVIALCGADSLNTKRTTRIIGGLIASEGQFPYTVSLQQLSQVQSYTRGHRCGGALISNQHVLTSASCLYDRNNSGSTLINAAEYRVFAGSVVLTNDTSEDRIRSIANFTVHPQYTLNQQYVNNIAIITLVAPFSNNTVTPVQLSAIDVVGVEIRPCFVTGWGAQNTSSTASTQLMYLKTMVYNYDACFLYYNNVVVNQINISSSMICTPPGPTSGCIGDLGNPLVCRARLMGVFSLSSACATAVNPEVYTRVSSYREWINRVVTGGASSILPGIALLAMFTIVQIISANVEFLDLLLNIK